MARVVSDDNLYHGNRKRSQYPWDRWLDGQTWELMQGDDFSLSPSSFRLIAQDAARKVGKACRTSVRGNTVLIRATPKEET